MTRKYEALPSSNTVTGSTSDPWTSLFWVRWLDKALSSSEQTSTCVDIPAGASAHQQLRSPTDHEYRSVTSVEIEDGRPAGIADIDTDAIASDPSEAGCCPVECVPPHIDGHPRISDSISGFGSPRSMAMGSSPRSLALSAGSAGYNIAASHSASSLPSSLSPCVDHGHISEGDVRRAKGHSSISVASSPSTSSGPACRYCFNTMTSKDNVSSCFCTGLLCKDCLGKELTLTCNRQDGVMKCTVCNQVYKTEDVTNHPAHSWFRFLYYALYHSCPCLPCLPRCSWFAIPEAEQYKHWKTLTALLTSWVTLTSLFEFLWGQHAGSIGRTVMFFLDLFALAEMHGLALRCTTTRMKNALTVWWQTLHCGRILALVFQGLYFSARLAQLPPLPTYAPRDHTHSGEHRPGLRSSAFAHGSSNVEVAAMSPEQQRFTEGLFSVQWFIFTSAGFVLLTALIYWVDMRDEYRKDRRRVKLVKVGNYGPFQVVDNHARSRMEANVMSAPSPSERHEPMHANPVPGEDARYNFEQVQAEVGVPDEEHVGGPPQVDNALAREEVFGVPSIVLPESYMHTIDVEMASISLP